MKNPNWRALLHEYSNHARKRDPNDPDHGGIASDGMAAIAGELSRGDGSQVEVVSALRDVATKKGIMDAIHVISHGTSGDVEHFFPEGATNRQIIDLIERA